MITKKEFPPGDFGIWVIIYVEFVTFAALFIGYAFARRANIEMFNESQLLLDQKSGFINTLVLITSSWLVVKAVQAIKNNNSKLSAKFLLSAIGVGLIFIVVKLMEFSDKFEQGINLSTNTFFMFYLMLTVFHFLHVVLGLYILTIIYNKTKKGGYSNTDHVGMETGASYWHLVDLLWIVLFLLVYIMR